MRRSAIALATVGLLIAAVPAWAQTNDIEIHFSGNLFEPPGSITEIYNEAVDPSLVGQTCSGFAQTENNASVWLNNDLIIASGGTSTEILNYEAAAELTTFTSGTLTLGDRLTISVHMGPGGVSSEGLLVVLNCSQPEPPTTEPPPATTPPTEPPPTETTAPPPGATTTEAPPTGGVAAGGGGTAGANPAAPWVGGGALLLAVALGAAALGRQLMTRRD